MTTIGCKSRDLRLEFTSFTQRDRMNEGSASERGSCKTVIQQSFSTLLYKHTLAIAIETVIARKIGTCGKTDNREERQRTKKEKTRKKKRT